MNCSKSRADWRAVGPALPQWFCILVTPTYIVLISLRSTYTHCSVLCPGLNFGTPNKFVFIVRIYAGGGNNDVRLYISASGTQFSATAIGKTKIISSHMQLTNINGFARPGLIQLNIDTELKIYLSESVQYDFERMLRRLRSWISKPGQALLLHETTHAGLHGL